MKLSFFSARSMVFCAYIFTCITNKFRAQSTYFVFIRQQALQDLRMGDTITFTTWPQHQNLFYKLTTNAVNFEVKAPGNAVVGLSTKPKINCDFWIGIGDDQRCWIKKENEHSRSAFIDNIITATSYKGFWITWNGGLISLGRDGETKPIVSYSHKSSDLNYITFGVINERNPVEWRLELPPGISTPKCKAVSGGKLEWVEAGDFLPEGALIGGFENETLYIVRAEHNHSLTPGKFVPSEGTAYIPWGGDENPKNSFEVLCGYDCMWQPTWEDRIPIEAFPAGYSEVHHEILYIGRAEHNGHLIPGKVQPSHKACYIPYDGKEIAKKKYEILVEPTMGTRCANKKYMNCVVESASESEQEDNDIYNYGQEMDEDSDAYNEVAEHIYIF